MFRKSFVAAMLMLLSISVLSAQCPMCRMSAESNLQNGGTMGSGLNAGILYMLVAPYLIVGGIAFWWWKNRRKEGENEAEMEPKWPTVSNDPSSSQWN